MINEEGVFVGGRESASQWADRVNERLRSRGIVHLEEEPSEGQPFIYETGTSHSVEQFAEALRGSLGMSHEAMPYFRAMARAMMLFRERGETYGHSWRRHGALGNLLKLDIKARRLMRSFWFKGEDAAPTHKDEGDDALDAMNYAAFFYGCLDIGLMKGREE